MFRKHVSFVYIIATFIMNIIILIRIKGLSAFSKHHTKYRTIALYIKFVRYNMHKLV